MGSSSVSNRATSFRSSASGARSGRLPTTRMVSAQADSSATNQPPQETQALPESPGHPMLDPFEDGVVYEELSEEGCDACSEAECEGCAACDGCACGGPCLEPEWFGPPWAWPWWYGGPVATLLSRTELFAGVHGFKSAPDRGRNGNFGFHEGFNAGGPLGDPWGIGWQFGFRAAHSDFAGTRIDSYDPASRNQFFLTTGLFHRKSDCGLQWAVVFDYLHDNYYGSADLQQLRTEMSWKFLCGHEIGFWGAFMTGDDQYDYGIRGQPYRRDVESRDLYTIFYRQTLTCGGEWRAFAGFSGQGNGLFGADILLPAGQVFAFEGGFSYLIPKEATSTAALAEESWAVTLSLVWYPVRGNSCALTDPFRPLLPVADNRYLIQRLP
ncbi:MAG: hypothetical protein NZ899_00240 [Thermoguttaceae bacterium]|nr:hypothetical protein [Thermoguttaceae bacterium]MDW8077325.1 hypothetical protein [Thermoguttaceae bacterium]